MSLDDKIIPTTLIFQWSDLLQNLRYSWVAMILCPIQSGPSSRILDCRIASTLQQELYHVNMARVGSRMEWSPSRSIAHHAHTLCIVGM